MSLVALFEATYPGAFRGGRIPWRHFWALAARIPVVRASARQEMMKSALYGVLIQTKEGGRIAREMMKETLRDASAISERAAGYVDPWEALTARGRRAHQEGKAS